VVSVRTCTISFETLKAAPFSLVKDDSVTVKIISQNVYGDSILSVAGVGAVIQLVPDAPINFANDPLTTTDLVIRFTWTEGASNGGTAVIDYDVYYDQGSATATYVVLAEAVTTTYY